MNDNQGIVSECRSVCKGQDGGAAWVSISLYCYIIHTTRDQRRKEGGRVDLVGGDGATCWLNYSPVNCSLSSAKIQR